MTATATEYVLTFRGHHDRGRWCGNLIDHRPEPIHLQWHHVRPLYLGGEPDGDGIWLCGTCHDGVHQIIRDMLKAGRLTRHEVRKMYPDRSVSNGIYELALEAYNRWAAESWAAGEPVHQMHARVRGDG